MKKIYTIIFSFVILVGLQERLFAQTYTMPSSGTTSVTLTSSNNTFYDPGGINGSNTCVSGTAGNYTDGLTTVETFCTGTGQIISCAFTTAQMGLGVNDILTVYDGSTTASSVIGTYTNIQNAAQPTIYTTQNCITFQFTSDASINCSGWQITLKPFFEMMPGSPTFDCTAGNRPFFDPSVSPNVAGGGNNCGGVASINNYIDNANIVETFCSSTCQSLTLNMFASPSSFGICAGDTLRIYDGASTGSTLLYTYTNATSNASNIQDASTLANLTSSFTSSGTCITLQFTSSSSGNAKGWIGSLSCGSCPAAPPNDNCAGAIALTPGASCNPTSGTTYASGNLTSNLIPPCAGTTANDDVWYSFVANNTNMTITEAATNVAFRPVIQVFNGPSCPVNAAGTVSIGCATAGAAGGTATLNLSGLTVGSTYYVRVYDYTANTSTNINYNYTICAVGVNAADCQGNSQLCTTAAPLNPITNITSAGIGTQEYSGATFGCLVSGEHNSRWYAVQALTSGYLAWYVRSTTTADIDFSMWGPFTTQYGNCGASLGSPLRCDYSVPNSTGYANVNNTGWVNNAVAGNVCGNFSGPFTTPGYATGPSPVEYAGLINSGPQSDFISGAGGTFNALAFVSPVCVSPADVGKWYILLADVFAGQGTYTLNLSQSTATFTCASIPAPVQLTTFTGTTIDNSLNVLNWQTESEVNTESFILQRSADGIDYETIATIPAAGFSTQTRDYEFRDKAPLKGKNVYRLLQTDADNSTSYSSVVVLMITSNENTLQNIRPNPTKGNIYYDVIAQQDENCTVELIDQVGRVLSVKEEALREGKNNLAFDLSAYSPGMYHLRLHMLKSGDVLNGKVIKVQ